VLVHDQFLAPLEEDTEPPRPHGPENHVLPA
jgi:hypothetical protein